MKYGLIQLTSSGDKEPYFSEFSGECVACIKRQQEIVEKCPIDGRKARHSTVVGPYGAVFGCAKKHGFVVSKSLHESALGDAVKDLKALAEFKRRILEQYEKAYKRLLHNVERNDAHIIQEFQNVVPDALLVGSQKGVRGIVSNAISKDLPAASKALTNIFKAAIGIKNELTIYQRLYVDPHWRPELGTYKAHKVFMNTAYKFYDEFNEVGIWLDVGDCHDYVEIDFECVSVVLFHILDNARKYVKPHSDIMVQFTKRADKDELSIHIEMTSLTVEPDEVSRIELEGVSGRNAEKLGKSGKGIGMAVIRDIVSKAGLAFAAKWGLDRIHFEGVPYSRNVLILGGLKLVQLGKPIPLSKINKKR